jgi:hypothetical protein
MINIDEFVGAVRDGDIRKVNQYIGEGGDVNFEDKVSYCKSKTLVLYVIDFNKYSGIR